MRALVTLFAVWLVCGMVQPCRAGNLQVYAEGPYEVWAGPKRPADTSFGGYDIDQEPGYVKLGEAAANAEFPGGHRFYVIATHSLFSLDAVRLPSGRHPNKEDKEDRRPGAYFTWGNVHSPWQFDPFGNLVGQVMDYVHDDFIYGAPDGKTDDVGIPGGHGSSGGNYQGAIILEDGQFAADFDVDYKLLLAADQDRMNAGTYDARIGWWLEVTNLQQEALTIGSVGFSGPGPFEKISPQPATNAGNTCTWQSVVLNTGDDAEQNFEGLLTAGTVSKAFPVSVTRDWTPKVLTQSGDVEVTVTVTPAVSAPNWELGFSVALLGKNDDNSSLPDGLGEQFATLSHISETHTGPSTRMADGFHATWAQYYEVDVDQPQASQTYTLTVTVHYELLPGIKAAVIEPAVTVDFGPQDWDTAQRATWNGGQLTVPTGGTVSVSDSGLSGEESVEWYVVEFHHQHQGSATAVGAPPTLAGLALSNRTLTPAFAAGTTAYTASVPYTVANVTVTPTAAQANATIQVRVNGGAWSTVTSGSPSGPLPLNVGSNPIDVRVTAQDGGAIRNYTNYTIAVTRAASPNANLDDLTLSNGTLTPAFAAGTVAYAAIVSNTVASVTVTPTAAQGNAKIEARVNGGAWSTVTSGSASGSLALNEGANLIEVQVTPQDDITTKIYRVTVMRGHLYVDIGLKTGSNDGSSWANALRDLQPALAAAVTDCTIHVAEGTYKPSVPVGGTGDRFKSFQLKNGVTVEGGYPRGGGTRDPAQHQTILSGDIDDTPNDNSQNCYHVFCHPQGINLDKTAVLDGVTIKGGNANGAWPHSVGGGVYNSSSSPKISNCTFASNNGSGMYNTSSSPTLTDCTFAGNTAYAGGGMYNQSSSSPTVTNCSFVHNTAYAGGGMYNQSSSSPTVTNCSFAGNTADQSGGGMDNEASSPNLTNCTFTANNSSSGGGLCNNSDSPTVTNCVFASNNGGGMYNAYSSLTVANCVFFENRTGTSGGGMCNASASPTVTNCTFVGNSASYNTGLGMFNDRLSAPTVTNCVFAGSADEVNGGDKSRFTYNLINMADISNFPASNIRGEPLFADPSLPAGGDGVWGTPDDGLRVVFGSPCIDAGSNSAPGLTVIDLAGNSRRSDEFFTADTGSGNVPLVDLGAYEYVTPSGPKIFVVADGSPLADGQVAPIDFGTYSQGQPDCIRAMMVRNVGRRPLILGAPNLPPGYVLGQSLATELAPGASDQFTVRLDCSTFGVKTGRVSLVTNDSDANPFDFPVTGTVTTNGDIYVDGKAAGDPSDGRSWGHAFVVLQSAFPVAGSGATIHVAEGKYKPSVPVGGTDNRYKTFQLKNGVTILGGYPHGGGTRDLVAHQTILSGDLNDTPDDNSDNCYHVFYHPKELHLDRSAVLDGVTITGGNAVNLDGGGMYNTHCSPTLVNCTFSGNSASGLSYGNYHHGGGMYNESSSPMLIGCTFSGNSAHGPYPGHYWGGGMYNTSSASPELRNCRFVGNYATGSGGGMYNASSSPTLANCAFADNRVGGSESKGASGGGMSNASSSPTLINCVFSGNTVQYGVWGARGGGIANDDYSSPKLTNCTLFGNRATGGGSGGGISNSGSAAIITNCILWGNAASSAPQIGSGTVTYSCIEGGYAGIGNIGSDAARDNPAFVDTSNGNFRLQPGSPCIDTGSNNAPSLPSTDYVGNWRMINGTADIGAYEFVPAVPEIRVMAGSVTVSNGQTTPVNFGSILKGQPGPTRIFTVHNDGSVPLTLGTVSLPAGYNLTEPLVAQLPPLTQDSFTVRLESDTVGIKSGQIKLSSNDPDEGSFNFPIAGTVTRNGGIYVDGPAAVVNGDGSSWTNAFANLQSALTIAGPGATIYIAAGTYKPSVKVGGDDDRCKTFQLKNGVTIEGGYPHGGGTRDPVENRTILSGDIGKDGDNSDNCYHVFYHPPELGLDKTAVLEGVSIEGGNANGLTPLLSSGGGMFNASASPTLNDCTFKNNAANSCAGGLYNDSSSLTVSNCTFVGNTASGSGGGSYNTSSSPEFVNCIFVGNSAGYGGGGMRNDSSSPVLADCTFTGNTATQSFPYGSRGGGMYNQFSSPKVTNCTFTGNSADSGGGTYNSYSSSPKLANCVFVGNNGTGTFGSGGGMLNDSSSSPTLINCTLTGNAATGVFGSGGAMNIGSAATRVANCVLWGNTAASGTQIPAGGEGVTYSCIQGGYDGPGNIGSDLTLHNPNFVRDPNPGVNGTWGDADDDYGDLRLRAGSPCIDTGDNNASNLPPIDLDGKLRIVDGIVDMGAYEYQGTLPVLADDFNDNQRAVFWYEVEMVPTNSHFSEVNQRLEFTNTMSGTTGADLVLRGRRLAASADFRLKVDWQFNNQSVASGTAAVGLGLYGESAGTEIGIAAAYDAGTAGRHFEVWGEQDGKEFLNLPLSRSVTTGTFYISYDSAHDELHLSVNGYGRPDNPASGDWVIAGLIRATWHAGSLGVFLEGDGAGGAEVASGEAWLDNFRITQGTAVAPPPHTLTVTSTAKTGVAITVHPDENGDPAATVATPFTRTYDEGISVCLVAPATDGDGNPFAEWQRDGNIASTDRTAEVTMDAGQTWRAVYGTGVIHYTISGHVRQGGTAMAGVEMKGLPGSNPQTDANGFYSASVNAGWRGIVTPWQPGQVFVPASRQYANVTADQVNQDYAGAVDSDGDRLADDWENAHFGNLDQTGWMDSDADGLVNYQEYLAGTDPNSADTDKDGYRDLGEMAMGADPVNANTPNHDVTISGTIYSGSPAVPLAGCSVGAVVKPAVGGDWPALCFSGLTTASGTYSLSVPTGVAVVLFAVQADDLAPVPVVPYYGGQFHPGVTTPFGATVFSSATATVIGNIDFTLAPGALVSGTVTDAATGKPVAYAAIDALAADSQYSLMRSRTRADGTYRGVVPAGTEFLLRASHDWFRTEYYDSVADSANAARFTLTAGQTLTARDFPLEFKNRVADHVFGIDMSVDRHQAGPAGTPGYEGSVETETDSAVTRVKMRLPDGHNVELVWEQTDSRSGRSRWVKRAFGNTLADIAPNGQVDGTYTLTFDCADGSTFRTTVWFGIPGTPDPILMPTQVPTMLAPACGPGTVVTSPIMVAWQPCTDPLVTDMHLEFHGANGQLGDDREVPVSSTGFGPIDLAPGTWRIELDWQRSYAGANPDGIPISVCKSFAVDNTPITVGRAANGTIAVGETVYGKIGQPYQIDAYTFNATAGQRLVVDANARALWADLDPVVTVFGPDGARVGRDDDGGDIAGAFQVELELIQQRCGNAGTPVYKYGAKVSCEDSRLYFTAPATGTYRIEIGDYGSVEEGNAGEYGANAHYELRLLNAASLPDTNGAGFTATLHKPDGGAELMPYDSTGRFRFGRSGAETSLADLAQRFPAGAYSVTVDDGHGNVAVREFTLGGSWPEFPTLGTPSDNAPAVPVPVSVSWNAPQGAAGITQFWLDLAADPQPDGNVWEWETGNTGVTTVQVPFNRVMLGTAYRGEVAFVNDVDVTHGMGLDITRRAGTWIEFTPVKNEAPSFVKGPDQARGSGTQVVPGWATAISAGSAGEVGQALRFDVFCDHPNLFAVQPGIAPDGTLTYQPAPGASGVATVTVTLNDDGGTANGGTDRSAPQTFRIVVNLPPWYPPISWPPVAMPATRGDYSWYNIEVWNAVPDSDGAGMVFTTNVNGLSLGPADYIAAGCSGLEPGIYFWRYCGYDPNTQAYGVWQDVGTVQVAYPAASVLAAAGGLTVTPAMGPVPEDQVRFFIFNPVDAQAYDLNVTGVDNGYDNTLSGVPGPDGTVPSNRAITIRVNDLLPGTYTWRVYVRNPISDQWANGPSFHVGGARLQFAVPVLSVALEPTEGPRDVPVTIRNPSTEPLTLADPLLLKAETPLPKGVTAEFVLPDGFDPAFAPGEEKNVFLRVQTDGAEVGATVRMQGILNTAETPSEGADRLGIRFTVIPAPLPDLIVRAEWIACSPDPGVPNQPATIRVTVANEGTGKATGAVLRLLNFGEELLPRPAAFDLDAGMSQVFELHPTFLFPDPQQPGGVQLITAEVDPDGKIDEVDEFNNTASKAYQVGEPPKVLGGIVLAGGVPHELLVNSWSSITGNAVYELWSRGLPNYDFPVKGANVRAVITDELGNQVFDAADYTDVAGNFNIPFPVPGQVKDVFKLTVEVTDNTFTATLIMEFTIVAPVPVFDAFLHAEDIAFHPQADGTVLVDAQIHAMPWNNKTLTPVPVEFHALTAAAGPVSIGTTTTTAEIVPGGTATAQIAWHPPKSGDYVIEARLGRGWLDDEPGNDVATRGLTVGALDTRDGIGIDLSSGVPPVLVEGQRFSANCRAKYELWRGTSSHPDIVDDLVFTWRDSEQVRGWPVKGGNVRATITDKRTEKSWAISCGGPPQNQGYTSQAGEFWFSFTAPAPGYYRITVEVTDHGTYDTAWTRQYTADFEVPGPKDGFVHSEDITFVPAAPVAGQGTALSAAIHAGTNNRDPLTAVPVQFNVVTTEPGIIAATHVLPGLWRYKVGADTIATIAKGQTGTADHTNWQPPTFGVYVVETELNPGWSDDKPGNNAATRAVKVGNLESPDHIQVALMAAFPSVICTNKNVACTFAATYQLQNWHLLWSSYPVKGANFTVRVEERPSGKLVNEGNAGYTEGLPAPATDTGTGLANFVTPGKAGDYWLVIRVDDHTFIGECRVPFTTVAPTSDPGGGGDGGGGGGGGFIPPARYRDAFVRGEDLAFSKYNPYPGETIQVGAVIHAAANNTETLFDIPVRLSISYPEPDPDHPGETVIRNLPIGPIRRIPVLRPGGTFPIWSNWTPRQAGVFILQATLVGQVGKDDPAWPGWQDDDASNDSAGRAVTSGIVLNALAVDITEPVQRDPHQTLLASQTTRIWVRVRLPRQDANGKVYDVLNLGPQDLELVELRFSGAVIASRVILGNYAQHNGVGQFYFDFRPPYNNFGDVTIDAFAQRFDPASGKLLQGNASLAVIAKDDVPAAVEAAVDPKQANIGDVVHIFVATNETLVAGMPDVKVVDSAGHTIAMNPKGPVQLGPNRWRADTMPLPTGTASGTATVTIVAEDLAHNRNVQPNPPLTFTVNGPDNDPPRIVQLIPGRGATGVPLDANLVLIFNENVSLGTNGVVRIRDEADFADPQYVVTAGPPFVTPFGNTVVINPSDFQPGHVYEVLINGTCIKDASGNFFSGFSSPPDPQAWTFTADRAPTDFSLAPGSIAESALPGAVVGMFSTVDPDHSTEVEGTFTYTLVPGDGSEDNGAFDTVGRTLVTKSTLRYADKPALHIRVRTADSGGLWIEKPFTVNVNPAPGRIITFDDCPEGTFAFVAEDRYRSIGAVFDRDIPVYSLATVDAGWADKAAASGVTLPNVMPLRAAVAPQTSIALHFTLPGTDTPAVVGYVRVLFADAHIGSTAGKLEAFDQEGKSLGSITPTTQPTGTVLGEINASGIAWVRFSDADDGDGVEIDNIIWNDLKRPLMVTAENKSRMYGAANPEFTVSYLGFAPGDDASDLDGKLIFTCDAVVNSAVGSYAIVPSGLTAANYAITFVDGTLAVTPKAATVTASDRSKAYGDTAVFAGTEFTTDGLVNGDQVTNVTLTSAGVLPTAAKGAYDIMATAATGTGLDNYTLNYMKGTLTVTARAATVIASNRNKTYGETVVFAGTEFTTDGLVNGDKVTSVTLRSDGATVTAAKGVYDILPGAAVGTGLANYTIGYAKGTLTVGAKAATVTANNRSKAEGDEVMFAGTEFTTGGFINGDAVTRVTLTSDGAAVAAAKGVYDILPSAAIGAGLGNYTIGYVKGTLTVRGAQSITFGQLPTKVVGDADFALTATASSGLPVTYRSSVPEVAEVNGSTVHILAAGTTWITASQAGNGGFAAAPNVMQQLEVKARGELVATHAAGGYQPGRILVVNCTVSWPWGSLVATLDWDPQLPDGWTLGAVGGDIGTPRVEAGKIVFDLAAQAFMSPLSFAYAVNVPPNASGSQTLRGVCHYTLQGQAAAQTMADPNPLVVVQRETVTAWQFRFLAANANQPELVIGMQEGATLEFDSGMDVVAAEPPLAGVMGGACVRTPTDQPLAIDHHAIARTGEWTLEVRANRQSVILSWNSGQIPAGTSLEFHEVDASMRRVAGTWRNLSRAGSLTVPVHTKCWFKVKFDHPEFVLNLAEGWNFVSLPIEPSITDAATLFSEIMQENAGTPVNTFGPLISGFVWAWQPGRNRFVSVSEVHALSGYWVYAPTALAIRFEGTPADPTVPLVKGFNTIGVPAQMALPANVSIGPVWWWDAIAQEYKAIPVDGKAVPGVGYWLYAPKPVVLHLDQ